MITVPITGSKARLTVTSYINKITKNPGDCGFDLYPAIETLDEIRQEDMGFYAVLSIPTRINLSVPLNHFALITGRSSSPNKMMGCAVIPGIIDHGYTGDYWIRVQVPLVETSRERHYKLLQKIASYGRDKIALAQAIIIPYAKPVFSIVDCLGQTERGNNGFGSTDTGIMEHQSGGTQRCPTCGSSVKISEYQCADCLLRQHQESQVESVLRHTGYTVDRADSAGETIK